MTSSIKNKLQNYQGLVVGGAIGDALGMSVEGLSREEIQKKCGAIRGYTKALSGVRHNTLNPGQYTDDTQYMIATIKGMIEYDTYDLENFVAEMIKIEEVRGAGLATSKAMKRLRKGERKKERGKEELGAGAMTRVAPLALLSRHRTHPSYSLLVKEVAALTHEGDVALASVFLYANILTTLLEKDLDFESRAGIADFLYSTSLPNSWDSQNVLKLKHSIRSTEKCLDKSEDNYATCFGLSGSVLHVLPAALYSFLKSPAHFEESVLRAVNLGGDTDTIAFVAGQLSGAYNGVEKIPLHLIRGLENYPELLNLGKRLYPEIYS